MRKVDSEIRRMEELENSCYIEFKPEMLKRRDSFWELEVDGMTVLRRVIQE
jgi:hypothetical protein